MHLPVKCVARSWLLCYQVSLLSGTQRLTPNRGFSAARFVPGSSDKKLLTIKSTENAATGKTSSFISVVTMDGKELMAETEIPGDLKYVFAHGWMVSSCKGVSVRCRTWVDAVVVRRGFSTLSHTRGWCRRAKGFQPNGCVRMLFYCLTRKRQRHTTVTIRGDGGTLPALALQVTVE